MEGIVYPLLRLVTYFVRLYSFVIIVRAVISWVQPNPYNPAVQLLYRITEPLLSPIRKALSRSIGNMGIDFSPIVAIVLLNLFERLLRWVLLY
jgi:YggT family protein